MAHHAHTRSKRGRKVARGARSRKNTPRKSPSRRAGPRWSRQVTEHSDALSLDRGVFTLSDPKRIASSLRRSALRSRRRKADPFRSALSMLTFYINRGGRSLPAGRRRTLTRAKDELRKQFGRA
ncbi:MAG TPA: DUF3175 domain-containing protein [Xanthobacteraceae bacterium]